LDFFLPKRFDKPRLFPVIFPTGGHPSCRGFFFPFSSCNFFSSFFPLSTPWLIPFFPLCSQRCEAEHLGLPFPQDHAFVCFPHPMSWTVAFTPNTSHKRRRMGRSVTVKQPSPSGSLFPFALVHFSPLSPERPSPSLLLVCRSQHPPGQFFTQQSNRLLPCPPKFPPSLPSEPFASFSLPAFD